MSRDDNCLQALIQAGVSPNAAEEKLADVQKRMAMNKVKGMDDVTALQKSVQDAMNAEQLANERGRVTSLMNLQKRHALFTRVLQGVPDIAGARGSTKVSAEDMYQSVRAALVGVNRPIFGGRVSLESAMDASKNEMAGGFLNELAKTKMSKLAFSGEYDEDIAKEMAELRNGALGKSGITNNAYAKQLAQLYTKYGDLARARLNGEGAWIGDLHGYIMKNEHDWETINKTGFTGWKADVLKHADHDLTFAGMDGVEQNHFLQNVYNSLVSGEHFAGGGMGFKAPAFTGPGNIAKAASQERLLHFTDDGWYQYWKKYGTSATLAEAMQNNMFQAGKKAALMRTLGTNPDQEFGNLLTRLKEHYADIDPKMTREFSEKYESKLQNRYEELAGHGDMPRNQLASSIGMAARLFENTVHLGFVPAAHTSIAVTRALDAHQWGAGVLGTINDSLRALVTSGHAATAEGREMLDLIGARNTGFITHTAGTYNEGFTGMAATANNLYMKATGLTYIMNAERRSHEWMISRFLGSNLEKQFGDMAPATQKTLGTYGIGKEEWGLLKNVKDHAAFEGKTFLTPKAASSIDSDAVEKLLAARGQISSSASQKTIDAAVTRYKDDLGRQMSAMFADSSRRAMNIPGSEVKALLYRDMPFGGQVGRAVLQFKQWPTELILNALGRTTYGNPETGQKMLGLFALMGGLTVSGYIRMALRDMGQGKGMPPAPDNWATIAQAAQEGGAGVVFADTAASLIRQKQYDEAVASLFGPAAKDVYDLGKIAAMAARGEGHPKQMLKEFGLRHIPLQNLWQINLLTNYLFLWGLHDNIHPGWAQRYEDNVKEETGHKPMLGPSRIGAQ
jgi:hypothetical protein